MQPAQGAGRAFTVLLALAAGVALTFLALPLVALFTEVPLGRVPALLGDPAVRDAIAVTARTNAIANLLILGVGTPFTQWAVVLAVTFVASPFYVRQAISAFEAVDPTYVDAARTLGASPARTFARVSLPLAARGLLAGWILAFARGVGEFGATIVFAGNVRGETQTLTLGIYEQLDANFDVALSIGILLVVLSGSVLLSYKLLSSWTRSSSTSPAPFARTSSMSG